MSQLRRDPLKVLAALRSEPTGFENTTDSALTFTNGTRTAQIAPTGSSFSYWIAGGRYTVTAAKTTVIADTDGVHYIYFDGETLTSTTTFDLSLLYAYGWVMFVLWNSTTGTAVMVGDERHGVVMDWRTHAYHHSTVHAKFETGLAIGDFTIGDGSADTHAEVSVAAGAIWDEDLRHAISAMAIPAQIPILYRLGATGLWYQKTADNFPTIYDGAPVAYAPANDRLPWNEWTGATWQLTEVGALEYVLVHVVATNNIAAHGGPIMGIQGQAVYTGIVAARAGAMTELQSIASAGLPGPEMKAIGTILFQSSTAYGNTPKARLQQTVAGENYRDWRYDFAPI